MNSNTKDRERMDERRVLRTVCSRPERRLSSKAVLRAKGDTAVIVVYEVVEDEWGVKEEQSQLDGKH